MTYASRTQRGFSMIEVLAALTITAFGLLGLMGIQAVSHQAEMESYQRAQALILLNDMVERINSNRGSGACYVTTTTSSGTPYLGATTGGGHFGAPDCSSGYTNVQTKQLADTAMAEWDAALQGSSEKSGATSIGAMIDGRGCVSYDAATLTYTIAVAWQGMTDTFAPVVNCANGLYGAETKRRVVWTTLRIATLS